MGRDSEQIHVLWLWEQQQCVLTKTQIGHSYILENLLLLISVLCISYPRFNTSWNVLAGKKQKTISHNIAHDGNLHSLGLLLDITLRTGSPPRLAPCKWK
ncbi:hypothetical protein CapIbe_017758 [Capra ibex]